MKKHVVITGGAGFIGINTSAYFINRGWKVTIFDNFSRKGVDVNLAWLKKQEKAKNSLTVIKGDVVTDVSKLEKLIDDAGAVIHLAAQVAVTTSVADPRHDFETNAIGSFNVLEAVRKSKSKPILIYSSTNKVMGSLEYLSVKEKKERYVFVKNLYNKYGIPETMPLDFHSPYGCSKGSADQYIIDYARVYGVKSVVFRQSCIYGQNQFGIEDQGWVAWFGIAALLKRKINIYGTGKQVRDILHIDDLNRLYWMAVNGIDKVKGNAYNIGGGPGNTISLKELLVTLGNYVGEEIPLTYKPIRVGDQPIFVCDIRKIKKDLGWAPQINVKKGLNRILDWINENKGIIAKTV